MWVYRARTMCELVGGWQEVKSQKSGSFTLQSKKKRIFNFPFEAISEFPPTHTTPLDHVDLQTFSNYILFKARQGEV